MSDDTRGPCTRGSCATLAVVTLTLLSTVSCDIFSEESIPAPIALPRSITSAATVPSHGPAGETSVNESIDEDFYRAVWAGDVKQLVAN